MLELFKERNRLTAVPEANSRRTLDLSMQESFQRFNMKDGFNDHLFRTENTCRNLKHSPHIVQTKDCKPKLYLCEDSVSKELGNFFVFINFRCCIFYVYR